jgi:hypothetical protein
LRVGFEFTGSSSVPMEIGGNGCLGRRSSRQSGLRPRVRRNSGGCGFDPVDGAHGLPCAISGHVVRAASCVARRVPEVGPMTNLHR